MKKETREPELRRLWLERPKEGRRLNGVLAFYSWVAKNRPALLPQSRYGDPYQQLKSILKGFIEGE
jgi:hypothetical protein